MTLSKKERLVNSNGEEEGHEDYTVAVVDNPLYAENEGELNDYLKEEFEEDKDGLEVWCYYMTYCTVQHDV